tara:strand:- start:539 stop:1009 length:471 start_codon:yes stop_codon:yes gene_type:complete
MENEQEFVEFLMGAKRNTYANDSPAETMSDGGRKLTFKNGIYRYQDLYYGFDPFSGQEIVWRDNIPIWTMNYVGGITKAGASAKKIYGFLKKALMEVSIDRPFRGPLEFREDGLEYTSHIDIDFCTLDYFRGEEAISSDDGELYRLDFHGGLIKPK